jgi:hypothetical protein
MLDVILPVHVQLPVPAELLQNGHLRSADCLWDMPCPQFSGMLNKQVFDKTLRLTVGHLFKRTAAKWREHLRACDAGQVRPFAASICSVMQHCSCAACKGKARDVMVVACGA